MVILVTGVRFNENGTITHIEWGEVNNADPFEWIKKPHTTEAREIIESICRDVPVQMLFNIDGHFVLGSTLVIDEDADSIETLKEGLPIDDGRSIRELPKV